MTNGTVYTQMTNGFGNNIFQYVAAMLLAEYHNKDVVARPPSKDYYAIPCLENLGIRFSRQSGDNELLYINEQNYIQSFNINHKQRDFLLSGYFEDYRYYFNSRERIKSWFPEVENKNETDLVVHMRTGDRLFMKNEFYNKPKASDYAKAIEQFNFDNLHIVTDMPKWDYVTAEELQNMKFHLVVADDQRVPISESVDYFNSFIDEFKKYNPVMKKRSVGEDFDFIRGFKNILFEHGTLSWWAAFLSDASKVGVYGPWRAWKGTKNKNLSQIPIEEWFQWE